MNAAILPRGPSWPVKFHNLIQQGLKGGPLISFLTFHLVVLAGTVPLLLAFSICYLLDLPQFPAASIVGITAILSACGGMFLMTPDP